MGDVSPDEYRICPVTGDNCYDCYGGCDCPLEDEDFIEDEYYAQQEQHDDEIQRF